MLQGGGDELQGIKKGIMELADALVINKADGYSEKLATMTQRQYSSAMSLLRHNSFWTPRVMTCSALTTTNIDAVWSMVLEYHEEALERQAFASKRTRQNLDWMHQLLHEMLLLKLAQNTKVKALLPALEQAVQRQEITAFAAVRQIMDQL
jgi:LAO/AO transport system kinase